VSSTPDLLELSYVRLAWPHVTAKLDRLNLLKSFSINTSIQQLSIFYNRLSPPGFQAIDEIVRYFTKQLTDEKRIVRVTCFGLYL
jgi:hypothetical protein